MTAANADRCIANTLIYEGGFGRTRADRGDWTSGKIGVGRLAGTAYGIAAMTLKDRGLSENFDLSKLTRDQAIALYRKKEWPECAGDDLPMGLDQITYDATVNSGRGRGIPWTGRAVGCKAPTNAMAVASTARTLSFDQRRAAVKAAVAARVSFLKGLAIFATFGKGWMRRCADMEAIGVKMVLEDSKASPAVIKTELKKEAKAAETKASKATIGSAGTGATGGAAATQTPDPSSLDWSQLAGGGAVAIVVAVLVIFLAYQAYKHFNRKRAYLAVAGA